MINVVDVEFSELEKQEAAVDDFLSSTNKLFEHSNEQVFQARRHFLETGEISPAIRTPIADSWKRCKAIGLNTKQLYGKILDSDQFKLILAENKNLIDYSIPIIENIFNTFQNNFGYLLISDKNGVILYAYGNPSIMESSKLFNYCVGSQWTEELVGTNAISLALAMDKSMSTLFSEHYCEFHQLFACNTAVIHDVDNQILGSLCITSHKRVYNHQFQALVDLGALAIQRSIKMHHAAHILDHTFNSISEAILVVNSNMKIEKANDNFVNLLSISNDDLAMLDPRRLFNDIDFAQLFSSKKPTEITETKLRFKNKVINTYVKISPIVISDLTEAIVIIVRKAKDLINISHQIIGNAASYSFDNIISRAPEMLALINTAKNISCLNCTVLIEGESGTGKELFAHSIHNASKRANHPFIAINCAALPQDLVESELFGYEHGSFTGALNKGKPGKFEIADGGTIFLDEIGELPLHVQSKLLRVLDNHKITRIGGYEEKTLDVRVIAATNRSLSNEVKSRNFREDLYYRLNVMYLKIPPLRERPEDIRLLADRFLDNLNETGDKKIWSYTDDFMDRLTAHHWNGNVRELQNIFSRAYYLCSESTMDSTHLPDYILKDPVKSIISGGNGIRSKEDMERQLIIDAIHACNGKVTEAAKKINMGKTTIYRKVKSYQIDLY
jgi:sigma-54 dependent transcriptional regulator, acetoin dehydrogenase operon transcriptional activator AcoR